MTTSIRAARPADAGAIQAIYAPAVLDSTITFEEELPSVEQLIARMSATPSMPWLVAEVDGELAGYAYASQHRSRHAYRWSVDASVYLDRRFHRQGIGRLLYATLFDLLRELGYHQVFAGIALPNEASVGLHERLGFEPVGVYRDVGFKHGHWIDVGWWSLPLTSTFPPDPPEPQEWTAL